MAAFSPRRAVMAVGLIFCMLFIYSHSSTSASIRTASKSDVPPSQEQKDGIANEVPGVVATQVKITKQKPISNYAQLDLLDKLAYQFPYDMESKFPAYIWQTWKYTPASGDFGEEFRPAEASWTEKHPGFIHEVVADATALHLIRYLYAGVPEVVKAYEAMPAAILKADFFRYLILLARGGIYSDIDTHALKSAIDWIPPNVPHSTVGLVVGVEADPDRPDWADWYSRRIQFCQWTIQSKSGHPVLREIVTKITEETLRRQAQGRLKLKDKDGGDVVEWTGPAIWTDTIFEYFNNPKYYTILEGQGNITWSDFTGMTSPKKVGDTIVLPITSFSPGQMTMGSKDVDDPMAYVKHDFEGTWKPDDLRHIGIVYDGTEGDQQQQQQQKQ